MKRIFGLKAVASLAVLVMSVAGAYAQDKYPSKAIDIIVPFGAGGSTDLTARVYAKLLQDKWGVAVRVVNQTGGNGVPAVSNVMQAKPDGYTILMDGSSSSSMLPLVVEDLPFKVEDRSFIALTSQTAMYFIVSGSSPINTLPELIDRIKRDPSTFTWTSSGGVAALDAAARQLIYAAGTTPAQTRPVIMKGGAEGAVQTAGGHVELCVASYISIVPFLQNNRLKPISIAAKNRSRFTPTVPTTAEGGFPKIEAVQWNGFAGPPNLPPAIVDKWRDTILALNKEQAAIDALAKVGLEPKDGNGAEMAQVVADERGRYKELFR